MSPSMNPMDAQIDILHQTSKIVSSGLTLDEMLKALIRLPAQVTSSDACLVYLAEPTGEIVLRASQLPHARLQEESLEIKRQLEARKLIERAKGILQSKYNLTEEDAYLRLRGESRRLRRPMRDLAEAVILAQDVINSGADGPLPLDDLGA